MEDFSGPYVPDDTAAEHPQQTGSQELITQQPTPQDYQMLKPHRGPMILVFGIISIVMGALGIIICACTGVIGIILGILALSMAKRDIAEINGGLMDPIGLGPTTAGRICAIVGIVLSAIALFLTAVMLVIWIVILAIAASQGNL